MLTKMVASVLMMVMLTMVGDTGVHMVVVLRM